MDAFLPSSCSFPIMQYSTSTSTAYVALSLLLSPLMLLHELDLSNNLVTRKYPVIILQLLSLCYPDLMFNEFEGRMSPTLLNHPLDAIFLNSNHPLAVILRNLGNSRVSVVVLEKFLSFRKQSTESHHNYIIHHCPSQKS
ncbi:hypothetical protein KSP40_PGU006626 [Platanthera guangdongensis]|uniref:Maturase K n=1 Tax=Platanthera guangdongensis TaxID=2320717 RepID=A0ABR2MA87_9ASPA